MNSKRRRLITFDENHVDVYGTDGRLRETRSTLKIGRNVYCTNVLIWSLAVWKQLPESHACKHTIAYIN